VAVRFIVLAAAACVVFSVVPNASRAQLGQQELKLVTPPLSISREQIRPSADVLLVPTGFSREQILHGDRVSMGKPRMGSAASVTAMTGREHQTGTT
jgi:hypothetical protein